MERLGNRFDLLVVDEAHHCGRQGHDEALELSAAPARIGLTATPPECFLARDYGLSAYDAAYLDLALRLGQPLATLDERLRSAADRAGVGDAGVP